MKPLSGSRDEKVESSGPFVPHLALVQLVVMPDWSADVRYLGYLSVFVPMDEWTTTGPGVSWGGGEADPQDTPGPVVVHSFRGNLGQPEGGGEGRFSCNKY